MLRCYVTDRKQADILAAAKRAIQNGVDMIQIREKDLEARSLVELVRKIVEAGAGTHTRVLVNDRLDVALAAGADGIHLPADGLPIHAVREMIGLVGVSTHTLKEVERAEAEGADFAVFGPIFDTPGKTPLGVEQLRRVTRAVTIPVLAIGGVTGENTSQVIEAGARGIAGIRLFHQAI